MDRVLSPVEPVLLGELFADLHAELVGLLRGLGRDDWQRTTSAGSWAVRDVAAHLLDGDVRRLSVSRDGHMQPAPGPIRGIADLVSHLDRLNAEWVGAARRISPELLLDLLEFTGEKVARLMRSVDPFARAPLAVAWAGHQTSPGWLDIGREYTERWHHQDQIREATGTPPLTERKWLRPVLDISVHALPHAYRGTPGEPGDSLTIRMTGPAGGQWSLVRDENGWNVWSGESARARCRITIEAAAAGRLLLHRLSPARIRESIVIEGDESLGLPFLAARAVMVRTSSFTVET